MITMRPGGVKTAWPIHISESGSVNRMRISYLLVAPAASNIRLSLSLKVLLRFSYGLQNSFLHCKKKRS